MLAVPPHLPARPCAVAGRRAAEKERVQLLWRRRNCHDKLAFQRGDLRNISISLKELRNLGKPAGFGGVDPFPEVPVDIQQDDIKVLCSNQNMALVLGGL